MWTYFLLSMRRRLPFTPRTGVADGLYPPWGYWAAIILNAPDFKP